MFLNNPYPGSNVANIWLNKLASCMVSLFNVWQQLYRLIKFTLRNMTITICYFHWVSGNRSRSRCLACWKMDEGNGVNRQLDFWNAYCSLANIEMEKCFFLCWLKNYCSCQLIHEGGSSQFDVSHQLAGLVYGIWRDALNFLWFNLNSFKWGKVELGLENVVAKPCEVTVKLQPFYQWDSLHRTDCKAQ